jgi:hypothetical protein
VLSAVLAAAVLFGTSQTGCAATVVRYDTAVPSVPGASLPTYVRSLRDGRVNGSDGLVLWRTRALIAWNEPGTVVARRLDGRGAFRAGASALRFPSVGCWRLTRGSTSVVARVVGTPRKLGCAVTVLRNGSAFARPHVSGIRGGWPWLPVAQLTTHGHDGDRNMKIPWWVANGGESLELVGSRLDAAGHFRQVFPMALSPKGVYPSIVDIPAAGCWLLRLRTGNLAGVLVVRAVDARG